MTTQDEQIQQLLAQIRALRDVLGEDAIAPLRARVAELQRTHVETEGGAYVGGNVDSGGGDIHVGDTVTVNADAPPEALLRAYYRALAADCRHLPLGVVDPQFARPTGGLSPQPAACDEGHVALHDVYVDLDVTVSHRPEEDEDAQGWGLRLARGEGEGRVPLLEALSRPANARAVLLGDPGSGKTTFVNYLTYLLARAITGEGDAHSLPEALAGLWPVRLVLRETAGYLTSNGAGSAAMLWRALHADIVNRIGPAAEKLLPYMQARLLRKGGLFLLDGLDEVPQARRLRGCLLDAIRALTDSLPPDGHVLLTARPYAYADPAWHLEGMPILVLAPFNADQVERFVIRWYQAVRPALGWDPATAEARGQRLSRALAARPYLADLASRPLLLTLMATLHSSWGQLPEDRADLYEESVKLLLARWQRAREVHDAEGALIVDPGIERALGLGEVTLRAALERLAFATHTRQRQEVAGDEANAHADAPADIPRAEVLDVFVPLLPDDVSPTVLITYLETRAGLLLGRREGVYAFPHRSFQEYLAVCHLANTAEDFAECLRDLVWEDHTWWREVFLLGVGKMRQGGLSSALHVINTLVPLGPEDVAAITATHWHAAVLAGQALVDLALPAKVATRPHVAATLNRVRRWLRVLVEDGHLAPRERTEAGDVLGRLGDPRPGVGVVTTASGVTRPDIVWCQVPAGPFIMGSAEDEDQVYDDEKPQHTLHMPTFYISRYPITNAQYRPFVEGDGYENPAYWTEAGWAWRNGAEADLSAYDKNPDLKQQVAEWLAQRPIKRRAQPYWWDDPKWGAPTRPVMGITWYEALAYSHWLTAQVRRLDPSAWRVWHAGHVMAPDAVQDKTLLAAIKGETVRARLPSEAEWEKAARGPDGRRWPWGKTWRDDAANVKVAEVGQTCAVGLFPAGVSPYGALDMIGNVWEWTRSCWGTKSIYEPDYGYPYRTDDGREQEEGEVLRVLRGASYFNENVHARCAYRSYSLPATSTTSTGCGWWCPW